MPKSRQLTWQAGANGRPGRWRKKHKGTVYYFPGGRGKTDDVAYQQALAAWNAKKQVIDAATPKRHQADYDATIGQWQAVLSWCRKHSDAEMAAVASAKLDKLQRQFTAPRPAPISREDRFDDQFELAVRNPALQQALDFLADNFEPMPVASSNEELREAVDDLEARLSELREPLPPVAMPSGVFRDTDPLAIEKAVWEDRLETMRSSQVNHDQDLQAYIARFMKSKQGTVSAGRADMLQRHLDRFADWCGGSVPVTDLAGKTLVEYHEDLVEQVTAGTIKGVTAADYLDSVRTFIRWLWQRDVIPALPRVMDGRSQQLQIPKGHSIIVTFTVEEVTQLLGNASDRTKLYLLLMLNCGMTQKDIADLKHAEVDWDARQIVRKRSKTRSHATAPTVRYRLWQETFKLLVAERSGADNDRVLLNANGQPLWKEMLRDNSKYLKIDNIRTAYRRLSEKTGITKPLKSLKKTSASLIRNNSQYASLESLFLGHAPQSMADKHYAATPQELLDEAIGWLEVEYGLKDQDVEET